MKENKAKYVSFIEEEGVPHYGLLLADGETIVCACCGGTFNCMEDVTITESCEWYGDALDEFIKEAILGL